MAACEGDTSRGIWIGAAITTVGWAVTRLFPDWISGLFTTDCGLVEIARQGFYLYFLVYPVVGAQIIIQNYFQSIGKPKLSIFPVAHAAAYIPAPVPVCFPAYMGHKGGVAVDVGERPACFGDSGGNVGDICQKT